MGQIYAACVSAWKRLPPEWNITPVSCTPENEWNICHFWVSDGLRINFCIKSQFESDREKHVFYTTTGNWREMSRQMETMLSWHQKKHVKWMLFHVTTKNVQSWKSSVTSHEMQSQRKVVLRQKQCQIREAKPFKPQCENRFPPPSFCLEDGCPNFNDKAFVFIYFFFFLECRKFLSLI